MLANPQIRHYEKTIEICQEPEADQEDIELEKAMEDESAQERADECEGQPSFKHIHAAINKSKFLKFGGLERIHEDVNWGERRSSLPFFCLCFQI